MPLLWALCSLYNALFPLLCYISHTSLCLILLNSFLTLFHFASVVESSFSSDLISQAACPFFNPTHSWKMLFSETFTVSESIFLLFLFVNKTSHSQFKMSNSVAVLWASLKGRPVILKCVSSLTFFYVKLRILLPFKFLSLPSHFSIKLPLKRYQPKWVLFSSKAFFSSFFSQGNINHYLNKLWSDSLSSCPSPPPPPAPSRGAELSMLKFLWIRPHCCTWITVLVWSLMLVLIDCFFLSFSALIWNYILKNNLCYIFRLVLWSTA